MKNHYQHHEAVIGITHNNVFWKNVISIMKNVISLNIYFMKNSKYIFLLMSPSFFFVHLKIYNNKYSLLQMKTSYLTFLEMIQILATYHYHILLLDNLRKSPPVKSSLPQRSLSQNTVHVCKPVQEASTSTGHDTESAIETTSQHPSSTSSNYIFNIPQPNPKSKPASSSSSGSIFTSGCTTTVPQLKR